LETLPFEPLQFFAVAGAKLKRRRKKNREKIIKIRLKKYGKKV